MLNKKIRITFKFQAFHPYILNKVFEKIFKKVEIENIEYSKAVNFPTKKKYFTVLRSPHIDKKARDQFEMRTYKRSFCVFFSNDILDKKKAQMLIRFIKANSIGTQLKIVYDIF
jgi:small subunit ribosomal protein S10